MLWQSRKRASANYCLSITVIRLCASAHAGIVVNSLLATSYVVTGKLDVNAVTF